MAIRLGVIGTGGMGGLHTERYLRMGERVHLTACCDIDAAKAEAFAEKYGYQAVYTDCREMMAREKLDAVIVTTWNAAHRECTIAALEGGANVFCEKPMAMNAQEALEMDAAAKKAGKLLMIGFVRRFGLDADNAVAFVKDGTMGDIVYAKASYLRRRGWPGGWFGDKRLSGGGPLIDLGVHVIDLSRYIMGSPKPVSVFGYTNDEVHKARSVENSQAVWATTTATGVYNVEDMVSAMVRFDNGALLQVEASFNMNIKEDCGNLEFYGTKAGLKLAPFELYTEMAGKQVNVELPRGGDTGDFFLVEDIHFLDCIEKGIPCRATAEDGIEVMRILDAIYRSAELGRSVDIER